MGQATAANADETGLRESRYPLLCYVVAGGMCYEGIVNNPAQHSAFLARRGDAMVLCSGSRSCPPVRDGQPYQVYP